MSRRRVERLNEQIKREVSRILRTEVRDPRVRQVTVTAARVTSDLSYCRVFVRSVAEGDAWRRTLEGLEAASAHVRRLLGASLRLRHVPEIQFVEDRSLENAMKIEAILDDVRPEGGWQEDQDRMDPDEETEPSNDRSRGEDLPR